MMKSSVGERYQGRQSSRKTNDLLNGEMALEQGQVSDYEENDVQDGEEDDIEDDEYEEEEEDEFFQQRMPEQHPAIRTTVQLMELMDGDRPYLDLNPHYQRNVVWSRKAKQMLIDSMFGGFFVPPVIFNVTQVVDENGAARYKRTCVDGKQRLTSIRDFMRGRFPWRVGKKDWYYTIPTNEDGSKMKGVSVKKVLPDAQKQLFGKKAIVCVEFKDLSQQQEIELFQRVQLGKPLTKAETFRASQGPWQDLARTFETDYAEIINLCRQNNRGSGFWLVLQCFSQIFESMDPSAPNGIPRLKNRVPAIEKLCSDPASLDKTTKNHLRHIFDRLLGIVRQDASVFESAHFTKAKAFGPIELISVCCMISHWGDSRPNGLYIGDIRGLRERLRASNVEVRGNWECWLICWKYIEDLDSIRGTIDGSTIAKGQWGISSLAVRHGPPSQRVTAPTVPNMLGRRNARGETDKEYRPTASARKSGPTGRKKQTKGPNSKVAGIQVARQPTSPQPFAGHKPVWTPNDKGDSSSSSSSDEEDEEDNRNGGDAPTANVTSTLPLSSARKRAIMELGSSNNASVDLEAKKAKLMAGRIKQEPGF